MRRTRIICVAVLAIVSIVALLVCRTDVTIAAQMSDNNAIVDFKRVFDNYPKCLDARKKLSIDIRQIKAELAVKLEKESDKAKRDNITLQYNEIIKNRVSEVLSPIVTEVQTTATRVAKDKKLENVYDKRENVKGVDITQDVINVLTGKQNISGMVKSEDVLKSSQARADAAKAAQEAKAKAEAAKAAQEAKAKAAAKANEPTRDKDTKLVTHTSLLASTQKSTIEVQFGADYDEPDITMMVKKARKNGLQAAYVYATVGKNGKLFCRARVPASSMSDAKSISQKLRQIGFSSYIVK